VEGFFYYMTLLFLNSIGTTEVVFILMAVLMLFGSKSLPSIAKTLGKGMREIKTASNEIKRDIQNSGLEMRKELNMENPLKEFENPLKEIDKIIKEPSTPQDFRKDNPETTLEAPEHSKPISENPTNEDKA
jgi:sec-independent protein translocase protein TatA